MVADVAVGHLYAIDTLSGAPFLPRPCLQATLCSTLAHAKPFVRRESLCCPLVSLRCRDRSRQTYVGMLAWWRSCLLLLLVVAACCLMCVQRLGAACRCHLCRDSCSFRNLALVPYERLCEPTPCLARISFVVSQDCVRLCDASGHELARGLVNYSSLEVGPHPFPCCPSRSPPFTPSTFTPTLVSP